MKSLPLKHRTLLLSFFFNGVDQKRFTFKFYLRHSWILSTLYNPWAAQNFYSDDHLQKSCFYFVLLCSSSMKHKWLLGIAFSASSLNVECYLFKIPWLSARKTSVKWLPVVCVCVHVCSRDGLLLRPTTVCSVSAVRMKTLSISTQQQLFLTSFCLTPNALQLSIRLLLCLAVQSSQSCCFRAASCPCNPRICRVWEIHVGGGERAWTDMGGWVVGERVCRIPTCKMPQVS